MNFDFEIWRIDYICIRDIDSIVLVLCLSERKTIAPHELFDALTNWYHSVLNKMAACLEEISDKPVLMKISNFTAKHNLSLLKVLNVDNSAVLFFKLKRDRTHSAITYIIIVCIYLCCNIFKETVRHCWTMF